MPTSAQRHKSQGNPDYGFTLIEIVAVLVLLGILAATAAPKFFDLGAGSRRLAAGTALNEAQVRINARFSRLMYAGLSCEDAVKSVNTLALVADRTQGDEARFGSFLLSPAGKEITEDGLAVSVRMADDKDHVFQPGKLYVPACAKYETRTRTMTNFRSRRILLIIQAIRTRQTMTARLPERKTAVLERTAAVMPATVPATINRPRQGEAVHPEAAPREILILLWPMSKSSTGDPLKVR